MTIRNKNWALQDYKSMETWDRFCIKSVDNATCLTYDQIIIDTVNVTDTINYMYM